MPSSPDARPHGRPTVRPLRGRGGTVVLVLAAILPGCTLVNAPGNGTAPDPVVAPDPVARSFGGQLSVQGSTLPVVLTLVVRGEEVEEAHLAVPELSMEAHGDGRLRQGRLMLELWYGDECRGNARVSGDVEEGGWTFEGMLTARDCTGTEEGALVLHLRPENGAAGRTRPFVVESAPPGA